jgi:hypothetical protein
MKKIIVMGIAAALLLPGMAVASTSPKATTSHTSHASSAALRVAVFGSAGRAGGTMHILGIALARGRRPLDPVTASAVVHFKSGDVTVTLTTKHPKSRAVALHAKVAVPAAEPRGKVEITLTVTRGAITKSATGHGHVLAPKPPPTPTP